VKQRETVTPYELAQAVRAMHELGRPVVAYDAPNPEERYTPREYRSVVLTEANGMKTVLTIREDGRVRASQWTPSGHHNPRTGRTDYESIAEALKSTAAA
jgi:hypothetical protein